MILFFLDMQELIKNAVQSALENNWSKAVKLNKKILQYSPNNIQALNRLAYARFNLNQPKKAKALYKKVLKLDPNHPLAEKNYKKVKSNKKENINKKSEQGVFIHDPGKTKQLTLINTAPESILCALQIGQKLELIYKKRTVEIRTKEKIYIGALPDDISFRLRKVKSRNNKHKAYLNNVDSKYVSILFIENFSTF